MYLWKVKALARDLKEDRVSQREQFKYVLVWVILTNGLWYLKTVMPQQEPTITNLVGSFVGMVITFLGTLACYRANRTGDDTDFLLRYFCLSLPVGVSTFTVGGLLIPLVVLFTFGSAGSTGSYIVFAGVGIGLGLVYYWRLWKWTRLVAHSELEPDTRPQSQD